MPAPPDLTELQLFSIDDDNDNDNIITVHLYFSRATLFGW
jgi:hypothetical protein